MSVRCYVVVTKDSDKSEVKRVGPMPHHKAIKVHSGMSQQINISDYSIRITTQGGKS